MVGLSETGKVQLFHTWLKIGTFQSMFDKIYFINILKLFSMLSKREIENLQFAQGVNFEVIDLLKNNGT